MSLLINGYKTVIQLLTIGSWIKPIESSMALTIYK